MREGGLVGLEGHIDPPLTMSHSSCATAAAVGGGPGSAIASSIGGSRVKVVKLVRRHGESYGFSLRGGREHGTGFFISHVEQGSEAFHQGLRVSTRY